ncbi:MAG TPA: HU family DNA-binding protein [Phycicoccus sp.]|nr:HU family DNA-binding protein [Phycicoccus sp.]
MNKAELAQALEGRLGSRKAAIDAIEAIFDHIIREVAHGGSVGITGFGTFEAVDRAPRTGRNPNAGYAVPIAAHKAPRFRPGTAFKEFVKAPESLPTDGLAAARGAVPAAAKAARKTAAKKAAAKAPAKKAATKKAAAKK